MPRKPKDPDNPIKMDGKTVTIKLGADLAARFDEAVDLLGAGRGEVGRMLLDRGLIQLAFEQGPEPTSEDGRPLMERRIEYAAEHLHMMLVGHAPADPAGAVVAARGVSRRLAQWADERALSAKQYLLAMDGEQS